MRPSYNRGVVAAPPVERRTDTGTSGGAHSKYSCTTIREAAGLDLEGVPPVLDRHFGPHAAPSLEYNLVLSQSGKLRDLGGGLGRNVQMLNGPVLTPPAPVRPLAVSPSTAAGPKPVAYSIFLFKFHLLPSPYLRPPEKQIGNK